MRPLVKFFQENVELRGFSRRSYEIPHKASLKVLSILNLLDYAESMTRVERSRTSVKLNRRAFPRRQCLLDLELSHPEAGLLNVSAVDISLCGIGIELSKEPNPFHFSTGRKVRIGLAGFRSLDAIVSWSRGNRMGLKFAASIQGIIDSWVGEVLASQRVVVRDILKET